MYRLALLGGLALEGPEGPLTGYATQSRQLAVLALLGAAGEAGISRDKLCASLWPESSEVSARHSLTDAVYRLRKALGREVILGRSVKLRLNRDVIGCDVWAFEAAVAAGDLETAAALYGGPFLDGFHLRESSELEHWKDGEARRLAAMVEGVLEALAVRAEEADAPAGAVEWWRRLAGHDPFNSRTVVRLMEAEAKAGDPANAVLYGREHAELIRRELGVEPPEELAGLVEALSGSPTGPESEWSRPPVPKVPRLPVATSPGGRVETGGRGLRWSWAWVPVGVVGVGIALWLGTRGSPAATEQRERSPASVLEDDTRLRIAALPWANRSGREEDLFFTDGIHEEIVSRLSRIGGLRVTARQSVMRYRDSSKPARQIAEELGVHYLLEAGLLRAHDTVRVNVRLIDPWADDHVWAATYDRALSMENLLSVQTDIARHVATRLEAVLTPEEQARVQAPPTADLEAYELYLVGRHRWVYRSADNLHDAIRFFEAAVDKDSTFALAWAGLADAWTALPWYEPMPSPEAYARGWQAAQRAFDLEPDLAEAHAALGALLVWHEWDWGRGEGHLRRAVALNPSHAPSHHLLAVALGLGGQLDLAIQHMREAIRLNPLGNNYRFTLANLLYYDGKPDQARAVYERAEEAELLVPWGILEASIFYMQQGLDEEAFGAIRRWGELVSYPDPERLTVVLRAFESPELTEEAVRTLEDVRRTTGMQAGDLVRLYLNLDAPDEALSVLREAIARRHVVVPTLGGPHTRAGVLASAEITAALGEAGVPIWEGAYQGKPPSINR